MSVIWVLTSKELRLLLRDRVATILLLVMPLLFILVLGLLLGEGFGQKPDDRLRVMVVDLDRGHVVEPAHRANLAATAATLAAPVGGMPAFPPELVPSGMAALDVFSEKWSKAVRQDLGETAGIKVETIDSLEEADDLVRDHRLAAVLVFGEEFSDRVDQCSFLSMGINPFFRDGVYLDRIDARLLKDPKQPGAAAIIEQVAQVSLLRVILPWMIGRAFDKLSDPSFLSVLAAEARIPRFLLTEEFKKQMGVGIKVALQKLFHKYNLYGKTWASLTKATDTRVGAGAGESAYVNREGTGVLSRGAQRYQLLVPSYTVMFAFFLVLVVGWVFAAERRQGTLKRLRAAPVTRGQVLLGKLLPCFLVSLGQGVLLLVAGRLLFGMRWGPDTWPLWQQVAWLAPVVLCTSLAAMGLALLVAAVARTEIQVAIWGALPVLVLALVGGCVLPREMMPEQTQPLTLLTPQGWALQAYRELLDTGSQYAPNTALVLRACGVLAAWGAGFLALAWGLLRLD
jgi:ABC-type multidrug transport system permease subunit